MSSTSFPIVIWHVHFICAPPPDLAQWRSQDLEGGGGAVDMRSMAFLGGSGGMLSQVVSGGFWNKRQAFRKSKAIFLRQLNSND